MDTPQSTALLKRLIAAVERVGHYLEILRQDLNRQSDDIRVAQERSKHQRDTRPIWLDPILAKYEQSEGNQQKDEDRQYGVQNSLRRATWFAVAAATLYAGITAWQTYEIRRNFRMDQRAFMKITAEPAQRIDAISPAFWTARFSNGGKTPAFKIESKFQFQFLKKYESPVFDYETRPYSSANSPLMWSGDGDAIPVFRAYYANGSKQHVDAGLSTEELGLLKDGEAWLVKNGRMTYEDMFGFKHVTTFCAFSTMLRWTCANAKNFPASMPVLNTTL